MVWDTSIDDLRARVERIEHLLRLPWLTPEEGAVVAGVHPSTCRRACQNGALRAVRINGGRCYRFSPADLTAWLERGRVQPKESR